MTSGKKRSATTPIEDRLAALRQRLPARTKKTVLQAHVDELISLEVGDFLKPALKSGDDRAVASPTLLSVDEFYHAGRRIVGKMRTECMRVHGSDIFDVPEIKSQIEKKIIDFFFAMLKNNVEVCFDALEKHIDNKPLLRYRDIRRGSFAGSVSGEFVSVSQFEKHWETSYSISGNGEHCVPVVFELSDFIPDGIAYGVKVVPGGFDPKKETYFADDASQIEMSFDAPETKYLDLIGYVNTCLRWPRVHRAECLYDAIYNTLEGHIRRISSEIDAPDTIFLPEVLDRLNWNSIP